MGKTQVEPPELSWLPGETIFSLCSRFHRLSGHIAPSQTTKFLFQHPRIGSAHDFPKKLSHLAARFNGQIGTAEEIAMQRTISGFFYPFKANAIDRVLAIQTETKDSKKSLKYTAGLLTSRHGASHPLKACKSCVSDDHARFGVPYWHISHQLPGAFLCLHHEQTLMVCVEKQPGYLRDHWLLPDEVNFSSLTDATCTTIDIAFNKLLLSCFKFGMSKEFLCPEKTRITYRNRLLQMGYGNGTASICWSQLLTNFEAHLKQLSFPDSLVTVPSRQASIRNYLENLIYRKQGAPHPVDHLILIQWLYGDWGTFLEDTKRIHQTKAFSPKLVGRDKTLEKRRSNVKKLLLTGKSARKTAEILGVSINTVLVDAKALNIEIRTRPSKLHTELLEQVKSDLAKGHCKNSIEATHGLSITTINRILRENPELNALRGDVLLAKQRQERRETWMKAVNNNAGFSVQQIRTTESATYSWLYRHDYAWLSTFNSSLPSPSNNKQKRRVRWEERDQEYANLIRIESLKLSRDPNINIITKAVLFRAVPEVARKFKHLAKMPLTHKALIDVLSRQDLENLDLE